VPRRPARSRGPADVDGDAGIFHDLLGHADHGAVVDDLAEAGEAMLLGEQEILIDRRIQDQRLLLEDAADAGGKGLLVAARPEGLALEIHRAGIRTDKPGQDIEQSRFAGAVLADQAHDRPGRHGEADVMQDLDRPEALR